MSRITEEELVEQADTFARGIEDGWTPEYYNGAEMGFAAGARWAKEKLFPEPAPAPVKADSIKTCNRHNDCDKADEAAKLAGWRDRPVHCHDEDCEDCIGK